LTVFRVKKVPLLRGLRWAGKLKVLSVTDAGVVVEFDAQVVKTGTDSSALLSEGRALRGTSYASPLRGSKNRASHDSRLGAWVYDRCTLSHEQFKDWTGKDIHDLLG